MPDTDVTDEVTILPTVSVDDLRAAVYVLGATRDFLHTIADAMGGMAAATGEFHDELHALLRDMEAP